MTELEKILNEIYADASGRTEANRSAILDYVRRIERERCVKIVEDSGSGLRKQIIAAIRAQEDDVVCAQCSFNGAGNFPMRPDGKCSNPKCVMYERGFKAVYWGAASEPTASKK